MKPSSRRADQFHRDFAPLEQALARARRRRCVVVTPEMMIVELRLTPKRASQIEKTAGMTLPWFGPAYRAMRRHGLLRDRTGSWEEWLVRYERSKRTVEREGRHQRSVRARPIRRPNR